MIKQLTDPSSIKSSQVRLVMSDGVVIVDKAEAFRRSVAEELDLILVAEGDIPVVKMCDVKKIEYEKQKGQAGGKAKKVKHIQIGPHTAEHDLARLAKQAGEFIESGHPVVLQLEVKGRDRMFSDAIKQQCVKFAGRVPGAKTSNPSYSNSGSTATYTMNLT